MCLKMKVTMNYWRTPTCQIQQENLTFVCRLIDRSACEFHHTHTLVRSWVQRSSSRCSWRALKMVNMVIVWSFSHLFFFFCASTFTSGVPRPRHHHQQSDGRGTCTVPASHDEFCGPASYQLHGGELQKQSPVANILSLVCTDKVLGKPLNYLVRLAEAERCVWRAVLFMFCLSADVS